MCRSLSRRILGQKQNPNNQNQLAHSHSIEEDIQLFKKGMKILDLKKKCLYTRIHPHIHTHMLTRAQRHISR